MQSTLDRFGRVVIPKPLRDDLHLAPGTALRVEERYGEIVLTPTWEEPALKRKGGLLVFAGQPTGDLLDAVETQRRERMRKAAAWRSE
ncbi:MAG: AbrB/MazE/SpoVT family DNA-binding domain-containing protein [bacterium]|nr:AbrB/MazE/SpoVT family DNA-binding domain-containing protein [bacterium]